MTSVQIDFGDAKIFKQEDAYRYSIDLTASTNGEPADFGAQGQKKKDSFVGTPLYVSPEMLQNCVSLPASDLWALGVMIYRMHTGQCPFVSPIETAVFQKILELDYEWPTDISISADAKSLVDSLLKLKPEERIGAGKPGTENDFTCLMKHPYFTGVDFKNLLRTPVPLQLPEQIV